MITLEINKFHPGQVVMTASVNERVEKDAEYSKFVFRSLQRHLDMDGGDLCKKDLQSNKDALNEECPMRIFSAYNYKSNKDDRIWIITEWARSATTILYPSEY